MGSADPTGEIRRSHFRPITHAGRRYDVSVTLAIFLHWPALMSADPLRVLCVEDVEDDCLLTIRTLEKSGVSLTWQRVTTRPEFLKALATVAWDVVLSDHALPEFSSGDARKLLGELGLDLPFIIVSGTIGEEQAVESMRAGAHDYVLKGNLRRLVPAVLREVREAENRRRRREAEEALKRSEEQLRHSQKMEAVGRLAGGVAHDFNNLLTAILGFSHLALERVDDPSLRADLEQVIVTADRAARLTSQLLAFSRQTAQTPKLLDLREVLAWSAKKSSWPSSMRLSSGASTWIEVSSSRSS
jgi:two-component system cell cycle sensor histidine kinase/response regulator CckA